MYVPWPLVLLGTAATGAALFVTAGAAYIWWLEGSWITKRKAQFREFLAWHTRWVRK